MTGTTISSATLNPRRRRLLFRAWRRGTREMDLIMGRFADARLPGLDARDTDDFERLLEAPDTDLFNWVTGAAPVPTEFDTPVFHALQAFSRSETS